MPLGSNIKKKIPCAWPPLSASVALLFSFSVLAAPLLESTPDVEVLPLDKAIRLAIRGNPALNEKRFDFQDSQIVFDQAWDTFYLPSLSLTFSTAYNHTVAQLGGSQARTLGDAAKNRGYPTNAVALTLGQYTLFNGFKDWNTYETARLGFDKAKLDLSADERNTRGEVIEQYFKCRSEVDKFDAAKRSVEIAEAIVGLVKSKTKLGSASERDIESSSVDLLNAKNLVNESQQSVKKELQSLNLLLGVPLDRTYRLQTEIKYDVLALTREQALKLFMEKSTAMATERLNLRSAELALESIEGSWMPIPTVVINGLSIEYKNDYYGGNANAAPSTGTSTNGNFDVSSSIALTFQLLGAGGAQKPWNRREVAKARIARDRAEITYQKAIQENNATLNSKIDEIKKIEENIVNQRESFAKSASLLEGLLGHMVKGAVSRLELRDAINQARESEFALKDSIQAHIRNKRELAELIGIEKLPGSEY